MQISVGGTLLVNTLHVWAAYRADKTVYEIEPALAECLARSPWPANTEEGALVLESVTLSIDLDDDRVVQDTIEHRHGKHAVAAES